MFPVWFFMVLMMFIVSLLYITRATEDGLFVLTKDKWRKIQQRIKRSPDPIQDSGAI